jgi:hypothetical protein
MNRQANLAFAAALASLTLSALPQTCAADNGSPLTLFVQHPDGQEMRLEYRSGNGWRAQQGHGAPPSAQREVALSAAATSTDEDPSAGGQPLSVFVDGPTGYVFVWNADQAAWQFMGRVAESGR